METIFKGLDGPERPLVVRIRGPVNGTSAWPAKVWSPGQDLTDPSSNWYFTLSTFVPEANGLYRRTRKQSSKAYGLMLDDIGTKALPRPHLDACPPSYFIETSAGNFQAGYLFRDPCSDADMLEALISAFARSKLCDPGAKGAATRLARLPFATNRKRETPFACRLIEWRPELKYAPEELIERLELNLVPATARSTRVPLKAALNDAPESEVYLPRAAENMVLAALRDKGLYKRPLGDARHEVTCPWVHEHTQALDSGAAYFEPSDLFPLGGFKCQHSHGGEKKIAALLEYLGVTPQAAKNRATIRVAPGDLHRVVDAAERELGATGCYYQRGGLIVKVRSDLETGDVSIRPPSANALLRTLSSCATWERFDARSEDMVVCDPPMRHVQVLFEADSYMHLPSLRGVARQPYLRADGCIVKTSGFDPASGIFGAFMERQFSVPDRPGRDAAQSALAELQALLKGFEFAGAEDAAAAVAAMLTAAIRSSLPLAPMFHVRANQIGSGKSYLCNLIAAFAGASRPPAVAYPVTEEECAKLLLATLLEAPPVVVFDNLTTDLLPFKTLCSALTEESISGRVLGVSKMAKVPTQTLFLSSGNNVDAVQDMARRTVTISLEPQCESPAARSFESDPLEEVQRHRGRFVSAALTIVSAFLTAGSPEQALKPLASYGAWSKLIRAPLVWLGLPDPAAALFSRLADDPDRQLLGRLLAAWREAFGTSPTGVRDVIKAVSANARAGTGELAEVVGEIADERGDINSRRLGRWVSRHEGQIVNGLRFARDSRSGGSERWRVVVMGDTVVSETTYKPESRTAAAILEQQF